MNLRMPRRHGAQVVADQLGDALDRWPEGFDAEERDMVGRVIDALDRIATSQERTGAE